MAFVDGTDYTHTISQQHQLNVIDGLSWTRGGHVLKFGVDYRRLTPELGVGDGSYKGRVVPFSSLAQMQQGTAADTISVSKTIFPEFTNLSLYSQDHWKLTSRLYPLNFGLRWEFNPVPGEVNGLNPLALTQITNFDTMSLAAQDTPVYRTSYLNFAPRAGFAWNAISIHGHPVVLRGGFGIYYDTAQATWAEIFENAYITPPFGATYSVPNISLPITAAAAPPPTIPEVPTAPYSFFNFTDPRLKLSYTEQYNLSSDFGLSARNTLTVSYVGNEGHRLLETETYPSFPNPNFVYPSITDNLGASNYNALQVQDRGFVAPGLQLIASYTWQHAIDNASEDSYDPFGAPLRGNSDNDLRQVVNAALNYAIPGTGSNQFMRVITQGWLFAGRFTAESGYPFDVVQGQYTDPEGRMIQHLSESGRWSSDLPPQCARYS